jgi:hypothetical protein
MPTAINRRPAKKQPLIHHPAALPISAVFGLRYVHTLVRKWAASGTHDRLVPLDRHATGENGIWGGWGFDGQIGWCW